MVHNKQRMDPGCRKVRVTNEARDNRSTSNTKTKSELSWEGSGEPQRLFSRT